MTMFGDSRNDIPAALADDDALTPEDILPQ